MSLGILSAFLIAAAGAGDCTPPVDLVSEPATRAFTQTRMIDGIDRPLVSSGDMALSADEIVWTVTDPIEIITRVTETEMTQAVAGGAPEPVGGAAAAGPILSDSGLIDLLKGDLSNVDARYDVAETESASGWTLTLAPKSAELADHILSIGVAGCEAVSLITLTQTNGDVVTVEFTD